MNDHVRTSRLAFALAALTMAACSPPAGTDAGADVLALPEAGADAGADVLALPEGGADVAGEAAVDAATDAQRADAGPTLAIRGFVAPIAGAGIAGVEVADELHPEV